MPELSLPYIEVEDALRRIVRWLRDPNRDPHAVRRQPIADELDLRAVIAAAFTETNRRHQQDHPVRGMQRFINRWDDPNAAAFHAATWDLCRRGILYPRPEQEPQSAAAAGWYFSVTPYGRSWLRRTEPLDVLPAEYDRFAQLLATHAGQFGPGFGSRAAEATRCYRAQTYLACCAMCGAAAESTVLALAVARTGDENRVLA